MNLYKCIYNLSYMIIIFLPLANTTGNNELKLLNSSFMIIPYTVGLQLLANLNNTSEIDDFEVNLVPDECCLDIDNKLDCGIIQIDGECVGIIPKGSSKELTLVAPSFNPFEYRGYCTAFLDSKPVGRKRKTMRDSVKIFFDTKMKSDHLLPARICNHIDEDPFNNCEPVNCAIHYNGQKSFFDNKTKRCVGIPKCIATDDKYLPDIIYDPRSNRCLDHDSIKLEDLNYVKGLVHGKNRLTKDIVIIKSRAHRINSTNFDDDDHTFDDAENADRKFINNLLMKKFKNNLNSASQEKDKHHSKQKQENNVNKFPNNGVMQHAVMDCAEPSNLWYWDKNKNTLLFLSIVTMLQFCLLALLLYLLSVNVFCRCKKRLERQYYNFTQDVSVTTPLIGTSNMETETTCQYMTESSNIDKKIQCYKSCQRDQAKISLSDDILSKCLSRRKWDIKQTKSQNLVHESSYKDNTGFKSGLMQVSEYQQYSVCTNKASEQMAVCENEKMKGKRSGRNKSSKMLVKSEFPIKSEKNSEEVKEYTDSDIVSSERIIKCHSFNYMGDEKTTFDKKDCTSDWDCKYGSTQTSIGWTQSPGQISKDENIMDFKSNTQNRRIFTCTKLEFDAKSHSTEKGAQASFTNDSLDDFLSERGMLFAGDDGSKYSNESGMLSSSSMSSKTSKNHVMKNLMSIFRKKSKQIISSEPGLKKSKDSIDLELIHMSRPTVYSSSNVDSEFLNLAGKKNKDSRSSL